MKKIVTIVLCLCLMLSICSCGNNAVNPPNGGSVNTAEVVDTSNGTANGSSGSIENNPSAGITMSDVMNHPESPASDFFCYDDGNGGLIINEYLGNSDIVVIPEKIDGKSISKINKYVFANDSTVKGIKLSSTIKEIEDFAFGQNKTLQYVVLGEHLETLGQGCFQGCESLKEVVVNDNVKTIRQLAFARCTALKNITLPGSVEVIEVIAFYMMSEDFTIIGAAGSPAETFANDSSINFEAK